MSTISLMSTGPGSDGASPEADLGRVVVTARLQLVAQAVGAALRGRGVRAEPLRWEQAVRLASRELGTSDVVVLLDDLASVQDREATCDLVAGTAAPCIVLTRRRAGSTWGALLAAGATAVLPCDDCLDAIHAAVSRVAAGEPVMDVARRAELVSAWEASRVEEELLSARVALLSRREGQILALLSEGSRVVDIAEDLGIAETTVRSQIKSMRRKLGADSQLAAVAMLHRLGRARGARSSASPSTDARAE